jgi:hypothetical protein
MLPSLLTKSELLTNVGIGGCASPQPEKALKNMMFFRGFLLSRIWPAMSFVELAGDCIAINGVSAYCRIKRTTSCLRR